MRQAWCGGRGTRGSASAGAHAEASCSAADRPSTTLTQHPPLTGGVDLCRVEPDGFPRARTQRPRRQRHAQLLHARLQPAVALAVVGCDALGARRLTRGKLRGGKQVGDRAGVGGRRARVVRQVEEGNAQQGQRMHEAGAPAAKPRLQARASRQGKQGQAGRQAGK